MSHDPIAVVGLSALFADAPDITAFWQNLLTQHCALHDPLPEWGGSWLDDWQGPHDIGRLYTRRGGFLRELSRFDSAKFGVMPTAVDGAEPDHFHALQLVHDALVDADLLDVSHENTGLIIGHGIHFHRANATGAAHGWFAPLIAQSLTANARDARSLEAQIRAQLPPLTADTLPGLVPNVMSGRIANRFDFRGPNYLIDGACASSLLAVAHAMDELRLRRADLMLAGGVNTTTSPLVYAVFCALGALSRRGTVTPFHQQADGTLLGEGGGFVVLQRLDDAKAQNRRIYAVIREIGQASDGRGKGVMAPNVVGETLAMQRAYRQSGVDPTTVGLLEAHGTGIDLGDRTELQAICEVFGARPRLPTLALGAVKANIGHCIPAAGIAGLIKTVLALHHRVLPPTPCAHPREDWPPDAPMYLNTTLRPWIQGRYPRRAGVNAFGFGGINTHALLEEWRDGDFVPAVRLPTLPILIAASASTVDELQTLLTALPMDRHKSAYQAAHLSTVGTMRFAVVASDDADWQHKRRQLHTALSAQRPLATRDGLFLGFALRDDPLVVLFPGEMAQYPNLFNELLLTLPPLRTPFDELDRRFAERDFPPNAVLFPPPHLSSDRKAHLEAALQGMDYGSEAVLAANVGLFNHLQTLGLRPNAFAGHSTGENAALIASGAVQFADDNALGELIAAMNGAFTATVATTGKTTGFMAVGATDSETITALLATHPALFMAMDNSPNQRIVGGPLTTLTAATAWLSQRGAICQPLPLHGPYHHAAMTPFVTALTPLFAQLSWQSPRAPLYSCQSATPFPTVPAEMASQALKQYTHPVQFRALIQRLYADGIRLFVEIGPSATLTALVRDNLRGQPHQALAVDDRRRGSAWGMANAVGQLFVWGKLPLPEPLSPLSSNRSISPYLPTYLPTLTVYPPKPPVSAPTLPSPTELPISPNTARDAALTTHFALMQDFLRQQAVIHDHYFKTRKR